MQHPTRFVLVGAGGIARSYVQAFATLKDVQLVAIVDVNESAAIALAEEPDCRWFSSLEAFYKSGMHADAMIICTPPNTHETITLEALQHGLHVLCEKPFALTGSSARRMTVAAEQAGLLLTMASKFRHVDDIVEAKRIVDSGILGSMILFENAFTSRVDMTRRWNSVPSISGGGVVIDNGTHSVDLIRYFLGPLQSVQCIEGKRIQSLAVEDTVRIHVQTRCGVMGSIDLSWSINKELDWFINIYGSEGTLQVGWKQSRYHQASNREWVIFGDGYNKTAAFANQIHNFASAIRGEVALHITADDAVASVDAIEAAYQSLHQAPWMGVSNRDVHDLTTTPMPGSGIAGYAHA